MAGTGGGKRAAPRTEKYDPFKDFAELKRKFKQKGIGLRISSARGDTYGRYNPKTKVMTLNRPNLREQAVRRGKFSLDKLIGETIRHEMAHHDSQDLVHAKKFKESHKKIAGVPWNPKLHKDKPYKPPRKPKVRPRARMSRKNIARVGPVRPPAKPRRKK